MTLFDPRPVIGSMHDAWCNIWNPRQRRCTCGVVKNESEHSS